MTSLWLRQPTPCSAILNRHVAPTEVMVYFYARQNRIAEAVKFAETMVNCVIEDTRTLPLERPRWAAELVSSEIAEA